MRKGKIFLMLIVFFILFFMANLRVEAISNPGNLTNMTLAENCISSSTKIMKELADNGFNVQQVNDTLKKLEQLFEMQKSLELRKRPTDYNVIFSYCSDIANIKKNAYEARDMLYSLEIQYEDFTKIIKNYNINISEVGALMNEIRKEIEDERYEQVKEKIPDIEKKIMSMQAEASTMKLFYKTVSRGFKSFIVDNYILLISILAIAIFLWFAYMMRIKKFLIQRKINKLKIEKSVLKDLIKEVQRDYFQYGKIPEGVYNIKTTKYAELIRDIDRQIPLLKEELAKINVKIKKKVEAEIGEESNLKREEEIKANVRKKRNIKREIRTKIKKKPGERNIKARKRTKSRRNRK